ALCSADGKAILAGGDDREVRLWDVVTGKEIRRVARLDSPLRSMALSRNGRWLVTGTGHHVTQDKKTVARDCLVQLWNLDDGAELAHLEGHESPVASVAISDGGSRILSGAPHDRVRLWDVAAKRQLAEFGIRESGGHAVAISHDGKLGLFGDRDSWVSQIDLDEAREVKRYLGNHSRGRISAVAFADRGHSALCCGWNF